MNKKEKDKIPKIYDIYTKYIFYCKEFPFSSISPMDRYLVYGP